jgi:UDP:flavonoid glycosyltransferase YjiC (YdhE family)
MFPLARAALDAGHEVRFGSGASVTDRIRRAGFAADDVGPPGMVTPDAVLEAVRSVLDEPSYRDAAARLAVQINDMPGPDEVMAGLAS